MARAIVVSGPNRVRLEHRLNPEAKSGEVLIGVAYAGICGTDSAVIRGDYIVPLPVIPGHEFTGTVAGLGPGVSDDWIGRRVTCEINKTCLSTRSQNPCPACREGLPMHCGKRTVIGIIRADGAFQDYIAVPEANLHPLPDNVSLLDGILTEPLAAAIETFEMSPPKAGDTCVVLGLGRLGSLITLAAGLRGCRIIAVSRSRAKLEAAARLGAALTTDQTGKSLVRFVKDLTAGLGADMVVEATGDPRGVEIALDLVRPRGTIAVKTTSGRPVDRFDLTRVVVDEVRIVGSRCGPFPAALDLLRESRVPLEEFGRDIFSLEDFSEAFASAAAGRRTAFRIGNDPENN